MWILARTPTLAHLGILMMRSVAVVLLGCTALLTASTADARTDGKRARTSAGGCCRPRSSWPSVPGDIDATTLASPTVRPSRTLLEVLLVALGALTAFWWLVP